VIVEGRRDCKGASIMPAKYHIEWPYMALVVGIVLMVAAAAHLLSAWVAYVIFAVLWIGFARLPRGLRSGQNCPHPPRQARWDGRQRSGKGDS
jgi:hypothetical protein